MEMWMIVSICIAVLAVTGAIILWHVLRRDYERQLVQVSKLMEQIINEEQLEVSLDHQDSLPSKIKHQCIKIKEMSEGCRAEGERDRKEIRDMIGDIAHQLRMPLANLESYLEFLQDSEISGKEREIFLTAAEQSAQKLHFLIESFIRMSRLQQGIIQIKKQKSDIKDTIDQAIRQIQKAAEEKEIIIDLKQETEGKKTEILHDGNWLNEAIYNLLDNAVKYSGPKSKIEVSLSKNEIFTQIAVRDHGIGIPAGDEREIFKRFYRGKNVTTQEGFGLGLYVAREIVQKHDGFIKVKHETDGSRMEIYLRN